MRVGVGSTGVVGHLGRLDDGGATGAQRGVDAQLVERGVEVGELGDEPVAAGVVVVERIEFGLQLVDGGLHFGAGREQFVDGLFAPHVDVGGGVGVGEVAALAALASRTVIEMTSVSPTALALASGGSLGEAEIVAAPVAGRLGPR